VPLASSAATRYHEGSRSRMPSIESNQLLLAAAAACEDKKAEDIRILALDPAESGLTDYFLICNGTNDRQNVAITDEIELRLKREFGVYPNSVEGRRQGEWILMDYVDFIVHVFSAEKRAFYGLERLRKTATTISVADLNAEVSARITAARAKAPKKAASAKAVAAKNPAVKKAVPAKKAAPVKVAAKKTVKKTAKKVPVKGAKK
jgi:ribosome-associated protein